MNDRRFIKPAEGLTLRDPATGRVLPPHGAAVTWDASFWERRLNDGDVTPTTEEEVLAGDAAAEAAAQPAPAKKSKPAQDKGDSQ